MFNYCSKCLYNSSHPFGLTFNKEGCCSGCFTHLEKDFLDWTKRLEILHNVVKQVKKKSKKYDCVVPVIGDAEDFYTVSKVLELKLNPLIVCVNDYWKNDIGWYNFHQLITFFDLDSFVYNPNINVYKELVKTSLRKYNHILLPFLQLHTSFPVHIAYERKIPLVVWGQNQSVEQSGKFSHIDSVEMSRWSRKQHDLFEIEIDELMGNGAQINPKFINYYKYPQIAKLGKRGIKGIYLSNYFRWDPLLQNNSTTRFGFMPQNNSTTFDVYERTGSSVYYSFHDLLKYKRLGYRKVTDHLVREIRHGRITKINAIYLEKKFNKIKVNIKPFFNWLGSTNSGYEWFIKHRLNDLKYIITEEEERINPKIKLPESIDALIKKSKFPKKEYITFGKGIEI